MNFLSSLPTPAIYLYCIAAAAVLVYFPYLFVAYGRFQIGYDRSAPRSQFDKLPAFAKRATWAHENAFESFMLFAAAALMAYVTGVDSPWAVGGAIAYTIARFGFSVCYLLDWPSVRSLMFGIGSTAIGILITLSLLKVTP
ncbi:MAG: MAPEG family protein [Oculatellaceae cyanobacterium Prado106]|nr:MAPEG family protein [Oculatellaceae cyanobacterium Prado106]